MRIEHMRQFTLDSHKSVGETLKIDLHVVTYHLLCVSSNFLGCVGNMSDKSAFFRFFLAHYPGQIQTTNFSENSVQVN